MTIWAARAAFEECPFPSYMPYPRMSVVVCVHNGEDYIEECLDGCSRLDYPNFEVIIVNDGSTDRTLALAEDRLAALGDSPGAQIIAKWEIPKRKIVVPPFTEPPVVAPPPPPTLGTPPVTLPPAVPPPEKASSTLSRALLKAYSGLPGTALPAAIVNPPKRIRRATRVAAA